MNRQPTTSDYKNAIKSLEEYNAWQRHHVTELSIEARFSAVDFLYNLLPECSRRRAIDTSGVKNLHHALSQLNPLQKRA